VWKIFKLGRGFLDDDVLELGRQSPTCKFGSQYSLQSISYVVQQSSTCRILLIVVSALQALTDLFAVSSCTRPCMNFLRDIYI
jgi:hypothetical protein